MFCSRHATYIINGKRSTKLFNFLCLRRYRTSFIRRYKPNKAERSRLIHLSFLTHKKGIWCSRAQSKSVFLIGWLNPLNMTRGNQREVDRQRAQKKQDDKIKAAGRVSFLICDCSRLLFGTLGLYISHFFHFSFVLYRNRVVTH